MILPEGRDPRSITIRRGGTLTGADHQLLALWAATCAEHVLRLSSSRTRRTTRGRAAMRDSPAPGHAAR